MSETELQRALEGLLWLMALLLVAAPLYLIRLLVSAWTANDYR